MNNYASRTQQGFTIIELLVVVVVIAILAAITIVSYNGITDRAKVAATQSAAQQAAKKVLIQATIDGGVYPTTLAAAGITNGNGTTYEYVTYTSPNSAKFCLSATSNDLTYFVNDTTNSSPTLGQCTRAWAVKGTLGPSCGANCYYVRVNTQAFTAGSYQIRCLLNGAPSGGFATYTLSTSGSIQLNCYVNAVSGSVAAEITGWGVTEAVAW